MIVIFNTNENNFWDPYPKPGRNQMMEIVHIDPYVLWSLDKRYLYDSLL